jgi:hypothetical protein
MLPKAAANSRARSFNSTGSTDESGAGTRTRLRPAVDAVPLDVPYRDDPALPQQRLPPAAQLADKVAEVFLGGGFADPAADVGAVSRRSFRGRPRGAVPCP